MLSDAMQTALNRQINEEFFSAYVYLAMASEADQLGLPGTTNWFKMQYKEELGHAERFINFIMERNGKVELDEIKKPETSDATALSLFESALSHEKHISKCIFALKDLARTESDHATDVFLEWFVTEQVEEEASIQEIVDQLKLVNENPNGLFLIDRELAGRQPEPAA